MIYRSGKVKRNGRGVLGLGTNFCLANLGCDGKGFWFLGLGLFVRQFGKRFTVLIRAYNLGTLNNKALVYKDSYLLDCFIVYSANRSVTGD